MMHCITTQNLSLCIWLHPTVLGKPSNGFSGDANQCGVYVLVKRGQASDCSCTHSLEWTEDKHINTVCNEQDVLCEADVILEYSYIITQSSWLWSGSSSTSTSRSTSPTVSVWHQLVKSRPFISWLVWTSRSFHSLLMTVDNFTYSLLTKFTSCWSFFLQLSHKNKAANSNNRSLTPSCTLGHDGGVSCSHMDIWSLTGCLHS